VNGHFVQLRYQSIGSSCAGDPTFGNFVPSSSMVAPHATSILCADKVKVFPTDCLTLPHERKECLSAYSSLYPT
jgi:hypothetical protein